MKVYTLSNGVVLVDYRYLGIGIMIENSNTRYVSIGYSNITESFYLNTSGTKLISEKEIALYIKELTELLEIIKEAEQLINK